jgi:hypothetical protein
MARRKMTKQEAKQALQNAGVSFGKDYHQLNSTDVGKVLACAKLYGYRKSKNASGSTGRMFFQFLQRGR